MSSCMRFAHKPRENEVQPNPGDNGLEKHVIETDDQNVELAHNELEVSKTEPLPIGRNRVPHLKMMAKEIKTNQDEANLRLEWKKLAVCLDRLFVFIFAAIHLFMILFIFVAAPHMYA